MQWKAFCGFVPIFLDFQERPKKLLERLRKMVQNHKNL